MNTKSEEENVWESKREDENDLFQKRKCTRNVDFRRPNEDMFEFGDGNF